MNIQEYTQTLNERYTLGNATEHTFRGDLQSLIESLLPEITATNEPKRQACGAPDYILTKGKIPVGYIEAKDIGDDDLDGKKKSGNKEQFDRYKASLTNLIFTDYIDFHFYQDGELTAKIAVAELTEKGIRAIPQNFSTFENLLKNFVTHVSQTIKSPAKLAEMMAGKARLLSDIIEKALNSDEDNHSDSSLREQMNAFKEILIHDITPKAFADVYAQTIAYGMFAARLHDPSLDDFSRQEAAELIPKSNPFLRRLFGYIAGPDIDDRILWVVDNLVEIFLATNVEQILQDYGKATKMEDPIIHFYETFLSEYDPKLRKSRGVWYTPLPVVDFIVRAVDDILKTEFDLPQGLADTSKTQIKVNYQGKKIKKEVHKVQILDPATGTGTFLAETVKQIYKRFKGQQGIWSAYVDEHLIPRLNGFELLMASYAMAHLKMDLLMRETGYQGDADQRFRIYLTNSLEEHHPDTGTLFANWLSTEANEANHIKRDTPVMVVMGNPPYSGESSNKGKWIMDLMEDYKKEPGGKEKLKERNPKWINDDYVKFIRFGSHLVERNGEGILAFINPHGFLDNPTFRGMRWHLMNTFDKIYTIDLHGNSNKKELSPDGSKDENVFDIQQGVSINLFIKEKVKSKKPAQIFHTDLYGVRQKKYDFLNKSSLKSYNWVELKPKKPMFFFIPRDYETEKEYDKGFSLEKLFILNSVGIVTARDNFTIHYNKEDVKNTIDEFLNLEDEVARVRFNLGKDVRDWKVSYAKKDLSETYPNKGKFVKINYRPFDSRWTFYTGKSKGFHCYPRNDVMQHFIKCKNIGLITARSNKSETCDHFYISNNIMETKCGERTTQSAIFPLYLYPDSTQPELRTTPIAGGNHPSMGEGTTPSAGGGHPSKGGKCNRVPNLNMDIVEEIAKSLGLEFTPAEKFPSPAHAEQFPSSGGVVEDRGGAASEAPKDRSDKETPIRHTKNYMALPYNPALKERARALRKAGNLSEVLFWKRVNKKKFKGLDFDRQKIIGNYIVDFYCASPNVVIEIDGSSHDDKEEYDAKRDEYLESLGLTVIHIPVKEVFNHLDVVMKELEEHEAFGLLQTEGTPLRDEEPPRPTGTPPREEKPPRPTGTPPREEKPPRPAGTPPREEKPPRPAGTPPREGNRARDMESGKFTPLDLLDYIYAVLHSSSYREKYKEFLKIDFPRVPYPKDKEVFWKLVKLGGEIRQIHLLESPTVEEYITQYPIAGSNEITRKLTKNSPGFVPTENGLGQVWINDEQYFDNVPETAWEFYIGGYQPAQKWLKDRVSRTLDFEDILHYQKIIVALTETDRLMKEVDKSLEI